MALRAVRASDYLGCSKVFLFGKTLDCRDFSVCFIFFKTSGVLETSDNQSTPLVIKDIEAAVTEYRSDAVVMVSRFLALLLYRQASVIHYTRLKSASGCSFDPQCNINDSRL
ncbi:hypothetical protein BU17DRAFT_61773 [Hysterangium stoloniferum]|nr:hypothetical protein BU17DRAFT_61773 [Hysterangium stoloniferum]